MSFSKLQLFLFSFTDQYNSFHQLLKPSGKLRANKQACQKLTGETHASFYARGGGEMCLTQQKQWLAIGKDIVKMEAIVATEIPWLTFVLIEY